MKRNFLYVTAFISLSILAFSCKKTDVHQNPTPPPPPPPASNHPTGWSGKDKADTIPTAVNFSYFGTSDLPAKVDLTNYLPPIGDQGNYGTCVAWATGYYTKTTSEAIINNYSTSQLNTRYQLSPKYLFTSIPSEQKGPNCDGTDFIYALDLLQQKGIASMASVPYDDMGNCNPVSTMQPWDAEASKHKIKNYRKIDYSVESIKQYLANKFPVIIGAQLSDEFVDWRPTSAPLHTATTYDRVGMHAYHALTIVGYDDTKNAFRIANSWGTSWGDNGFIWVDYNFLLNNFVYNNNLYVLSSEDVQPTPDPTPDPNDNSGVDLAAWVTSDVSSYDETNDARSRSLTFNIYNIGSQAAQPSANWSVYYIYYNAFNANDYGVIFQDDFNGSIPSNSYDCSTQNACTINYSIAPGSSLSQSLFNDNKGLIRNYRVPALNGFYYLIMVVDPAGKLNERNMENNIFYTTEQAPKLFLNGYSNRLGNNKDFNFRNRIESSVTNLRKSEFNTAVNNQYRNAYRPQEIIGFIKHKLQTGEFKKKH